MTPTVAIILRAKDEMPHVQRTIEMLKRQTFQNFDLFAVDSGSSDGTLQVLEAECPQERLKKIAPEEYIPGKVLNHAIQQTDHQYIVLLNADAVPCSNDFLEQLLQPLLENRSDAVFAKQIARPDAHFIVSYDYERAYGSGKMATDFFSAVACAFHRKLWAEHSFRDYGYAEDLAWAKACIAGGARFRFVADAVVEHSHNYTFGALYRKRYRQAVTFTQAPMGRQVYLCLKEVARDFLHACRSIKMQTIPYNIAYRIVIHAAILSSRKKGGRMGNGPRNASC